MYVHVHVHARANYDDLFDHLVYRLSVKVDSLSIIQLSQITFLMTGKGIFESNMIVLFTTYTQDCNIYHYWLYIIILRTLATLICIGHASVYNGLSEVYRRFVVEPCMVPQTQGVCKWWFVHYHKVKWGQACTLLQWNLIIYLTFQPVEVI